MVCPTPPQQIVFQEYLRAVTEQQERRQRLERELHEAVKGWRLYPVVEAIQALRGVELTGAVILMTELGDITRFDNPRQLMSYLGLTPSEYSSGERRRQGGITKAGNSHARRALVEGAWAYRYPAKVSRHLQLRLEKLPAEIQAISWKAQVRLCKRYRQLTARGKHVNQVVVAIAREMAAFAWAIARLVPRGLLTGAARRGRRSAEPLIPTSSHRRRRGPGIGAIFDRVMRLRPSPLERSRRRDGHLYGGTQPTDISMINRRCYRPRLFRWLEQPS